MFVGGTDCGGGVGGRSLGDIRCVNLGHHQRALEHRRGAVTGHPLHVDLLTRSYPRNISMGGHHKGGIRDGAFGSNLAFGVRNLVVIKKQGYMLCLSGGAGAEVRVAFQCPAEPHQIVAGPRRDRHPRQRLV